MRGRKLGETTCFHTMANCFPTSIAEAEPPTSGRIKMQTDV